MHLYFYEILREAHRALWSENKDGELALSCSTFHGELTGLKPFGYRERRHGETLWVLDNTKIANFVNRGVFPHRKQHTVASLLWMQTKLVARCTLVNDRLVCERNGYMRHAYAVQIVNLQDEIKHIGELVKSMALAKAKQSMN